MDYDTLIDEALGGQERATRSAEAWGKLKKVFVELKHGNMTRDDAVRTLKIEREKMAMRGMAGAQLVYSFGLHSLGEEE